MTELEVSIYNKSVYDKNDNRVSLLLHSIFLEFGQRE